MLFWRPDATKTRPLHQHADTLHITLFAVMKSEESDRLLSRPALLVNLLQHPPETDFLYSSLLYQVRCLGATPKAFFLYGCGQYVPQSMLMTATRGSIPSPFPPSLQSVPVLKNNTKEIRRYSLLPGYHSSTHIGHKLNGVRVIRGHRPLCFRVAHSQLSTSSEVTLIRSPFTDRAQLPPHVQCSYRFS